MDEWDLTLTPANLKNSALKENKYRKFQTK